MVSTVSSQPTKTEILVMSSCMEGLGGATNQELNQIHKFYETLINVPISGELIWLVDPSLSWSSKIKLETCVLLRSNYLV